MKEISLFSLDTDDGFATAVASHLGLALGRHEERNFEDGEHKIRPLESVRGRDVYLVQSLYGDGQFSVNDKLIRVLFFIGALRDAGAARITLVAPYLCYSRKDRQTKPRDPLSFRYLAQLIEAVGVDRVVTLEVHNPAAFQNAFRCPTVHLVATSVFLDELVPQLSGLPVTVASPDVGGMKRADTFRDALEARLGTPVASALMEKRRSGDVVSGDMVAGELEGRAVIIIDDMIASGTTLTRAARAFLERGAQSVIAVATHGVFSTEAADILATPDLQEVIVANSIPPVRLPPGPALEKVKFLDVAPLIAQAIGRLHRDESITELTATEPPIGSRPTLFEGGGPQLL